MKHLSIIFVALAAFTAFTTGCSEQSDARLKVADQEFVAPWHKDGEGISLCGATKESINLKTASVAERTEGTEQILTVPKAAVLNTTAGASVYVENGDYYKRTDIKVGRTFGDSVEIKEGVYEGDVVVTGAAQTLWLIELRAVKGGKGCCPMPDAKGGPEEVGHAH